MAYGKVQWEEIIYGYGDSPNAWNNKKNSVGLDFPNLPYIKINGNGVSETLAVHQYIARSFCPAVLGATPEERARRLTLQCIIHEGCTACLKTCF